MEISRNEIILLFQGSIIHCAATPGVFKAGPETIYVDVVVAAERHLNHYGLGITKIDISHLEDKKKYKIYELFESYVKGELIIV